MSSWASDAIFYHVFPLGLCGAPHENDGSGDPVPRLERIHGWLDHIQGLGANTLLLGPVFESMTHGYDTRNFAFVDRRLGTEATLRALAAAVHGRGMRLVLDGVFNHVGREFWAFQHVREHGASSPYCAWFQDLHFGRSSPLGDPFRYACWQGHFELVRLDLGNPAVRQHLFLMVERWIQELGVDGLRLDAADCLDFDFMAALSSFCRGLKPDFWLMGEVIHGDYRRWVRPGLLDATTNYELYKGLFSSHVDSNYHEVAHTLLRQAGPHGIYRGLQLYNFADNHDVSRVASSLRDPAHLYPLHILLFTIPGTPSIYAGSEWGLRAEKGQGPDWNLRPALDLASSPASAPSPDLAPAITRLAALRRNLAPLRHGDYQQLSVTNLQLAFSRRYQGEEVIVMVNGDKAPARVVFPGRGRPQRWADLLNPGDVVTLGARNVAVTVPGCWGRVLTSR